MRSRKVFVTSVAIGVRSSGGARGTISGPAAIIWVKVNWNGDNIRGPRA